MSASLWFAGAAIWISGVAATFGGLHRYAAQPAVTQVEPGGWPPDSNLTLASDRFTLVMWVHPHCPCTRASARELAELAARVGDRVRIFALVATRDGAPDHWDSTGLVASIAAIPGVEIVHDDGREQRRFDARASGEVRFFAPSGALMFSGGITSARGHEGDNAGRTAIETIVEDEAAVIDQTPTFGCPLGVS